MHYSCFMFPGSKTKHKIIIYFGAKFYCPEIAACTRPWFRDFGTLPPHHLLAVVDARRTFAEKKREHEEAEYGRLLRPTTSIQCDRGVCKTELMAIHHSRKARQKIRIG